MTDTLPAALYTAAQVREIDARLIAAGTPGFELMQRAAHVAWRALRRRWPEADTLTVLAGSGNNAGDGYLIAALAQRAGWSVQVLAVADPQRLQGDAASAFAEAQNSGAAIEAWSVAAPLQGVVVDALLGTGLSGEVREPYAGAIAALNASGLPVMAVDLPSGLCADTGRVLGCAVRAELTVSFIGLKLGLFTGEGPAYVGALVFDDLQADAAIVEQFVPGTLRLCEANLPRLAPRSPTAHKGSFGQVLVIGGDLGTGGAALLSAEAALRCGAGMVTLATRPEHVTASLVRRPEIMCSGVESTYGLTALAQRADVLVIGPGLGQAPWGRSLLSLAAQCPVPQVWDADALNLLADNGIEAPVDGLLTPHPGEAARLLQCTTAEVQADRPRAARELARRYRCTVILKGAGSLIAAADGRLALCSRGHPAMASAGLGDVLAGVAGALLAQGLASFEAACLAVWLHAVAGERNGELGRGLAAADLIATIREQLESHSPCRS
ncbi:MULTISPECIES: NAD(P)H-hydrate dehydratase [Pseudomonadaceae]|uniref:NAD(P)H-hydrate dehydratase n=1 Tax=Pseudomonadaceae TaxID=135621 RepID=UPI000F79B5DA|nr:MULTISPECIES: NAD(P)H-hydrate dehydratase [Pseudomonadaceae]MCF6781598.1 NAD(P)H-hydrate dehydratase [Stutzerimonas stutzeri]MCF6804267.1 NAD(P)H-hydrate dehydratase [Stutzerimonas stutzeri]RRV15671.1 NAD(P)H-hydrate dehydratase [Pseudomonas saudiphocaensis]